jgi:hypothetical protein
MSAASGRFVWFDLMTPDISGAKSFYSEVVGWQTNKWSGGDYEMWRAGGEDIGGVMGIGSSDGQDSSNPQWMAYVGSDDIEATADKARGLGGEVIVPPRDIPSVGRFAVLADPQKAPIAVFQTMSQPMVPDTRKLGHFGWAELNTSDWKEAWKFYSTLFGWQQTSSVNMGPEYGEYVMFGVDAKQAFGGMSSSAALMKARPHWLYYVNVKSVDDTAKKVVEKGGKGLNGPMDVPGGGRVAQCLDPQGARFAIFSAPAS